MGTDWSTGGPTQTSGSTSELCGDEPLPQVAQRASGASSLEISKSLLDVVRGNLLRVALLEQGLDYMHPEVPASLGQSVVWGFCESIASWPPFSPAKQHNLHCSQSEDR